MFTFSTLLEAVINATEERGSEFQTFLTDVAFTVVHEKLANRFDTLGLVSVAYTSLVTANPYVVKPDGLRALKSFNVVTSSGYRIPLVLKTDEFLLAYWPDRSSVGSPKYYANWADDHFLIAPADGSGREVELEYEVSPSVLSSTTSENWYTKYAGSALYAGLMAEAYKFMKNWEAAAIWSQEFEKEVDLIVKNSERSRRDDTAEVPGPTTNTKGGQG